MNTWSVHSEHACVCSEFMCACGEEGPICSEWMCVCESVHVCAASAHVCLWSVRVCECLCVCTHGYVSGLVQECVHGACLHACMCMHI